MEIISSKDNEFVKNIRRLKDKKSRDEQNVFIIEGIKIIEEAIIEKADIRQIIMCEECEKTVEISKELMYEIAKYDCKYVSENVFKTLTTVINPQGIMAVVNKKDREEIKYDEELIVALDGIQDPGNLGAILRTVDSVGIKQILVSRETADVYNPKVVRSTMGAIFRVRVIICEDLNETIKILKKHKFKTVVTDLKTENSIYDIQYEKKVIVIGNEANGVSEEILNTANYKVKIPMLGKTESLNASVATGVILYEYVRQKISK